MIVMHGRGIEGWRRWGVEGVSVCWAESNLGDTFKAMKGRKGHRGGGTSSGQAERGTNTASAVGVRFSRRVSSLPPSLFPRG